MLNNQLELNPDGAAVKPTEKLSLFPKQTLTNTPAYQQDLATKYNTALGVDGPGEDVVLSSMKGGQLDSYKRLLANRKALEMEASKTALLQGIANSGQATQFDLEIVQGLSQDQINSPDLSSILDEEYAKKLTDLQANLLEENDNTLSEAVDSNPDAAYEALDRTEWQTARNFIASNILNGLQEKFNSSGLISQGIAFAQQLVPFRDDVSLWTTDLGPMQKSFFKGDTKEDAYAYLNTLPPVETKKSLEAYVNREMETGNYIGALQFVEGFLSYSDSDKNWDNIFQGLDIASFLPVGALVKGMKGASRAVMAPARDLERMASAASLPAEAVRATFTESLAKGVLPSHNIKGLADVERIVPSIMRPQELFNGRTLRAGGPATARLEQATVARAGTAMRILSEVNRVERLSPLEIEKGFDEAEQFLKNNFVNINHKIVDVKRNLAENSLGNVYSVDIQIGKTDGTPFATKLGAYKAAKTVGLKTNDHTVVQLPSGGWVVQVGREVDETSLGVRGVKIDTDYKLPDNWQTRFFGKLLGADSLLSKSQTSARGVAVMSSEHMGHLLEDFSAPISRMTKKGRKEFEEFIIRDRDFVDPQNGRGVPRQTVFDFEDAFYTQFNKLPTFDQIDAYSSFKQLYDLDWIIRDLDVFKQKTTMGIENFGFKLKGADGTSNIVKFEGKEVNDLPRGTRETFVIGVVDDEGNLIKGNGFNSRYMSSKDWDEINRLRQDGYTFIQSFKGSTKLNDNYFNFIMVRNFKRDRIALGDLTYSKGSRVIQKHPYYLKQPRINAKDGRAYYRGDTSIGNFRSLEEAMEANEIMKTAIRMVRNREKGVVKFFNDNIPFFSLKDFLYEVKKGNLSLDAPVYATKQGTRTIDGNNVADDLNALGVKVNEFVTDNEFNLSNRITGRFLGDRQETNMDAFGVEKGTIFKLEGDQILSPLDTMRYSMGNMVDTHVIHDYRLKSTRDFTNTYSDILDGDRSDFDAEGLSYIFEPRYRSGADPNRVKSAESQRTAILSLFNNKTYVEKQLDMYKERIVRSVRNKFGDNIANFVEDKALPAAQNADVAMRAFAFHTKMGFFNIRQLFLQTSSAVNIIGIAGPINGARGAMAAWPLIFAMNSKKGFVRGMAEKLKGITTFSADEFDELANMYRRSGFYHVGGDVAYLDNFKPPSIVKGKLNSVLQVGAVPFKTGESIARSMAFATAYIERKGATKGKVLNRADEAWILQRAKDLTGNMTRDSNAAYQRGYGAVATQFFGYQMRLMEQFLGNKLTLAEKARLFTMMGIAYGIPVSVGMTFGVVPVREWLKDDMAKNGFVYDNTAVEPFMDGFLATWLEQATGMDLNVSEKFGPGGLTTFYDMLKGDAELSDILLGASGGIIGDTIKDANPIIKFMWEAVDFNDQTNFPLSVNDLAEPLRNISTINNAIKLWEAFHTGQWLSKNENVLSDVTIQEALTSAVMGLDPERVSDAFNQIEALNARKDMQNEAMKLMVVDYKRALQLMNDGFTKEAATYMSQAKSRGATAGLDIRQMNTAFRRAIDGRPLNETIEDQYTTTFGKK